MKPELFSSAQVIDEQGKTQPLSQILSDKLNILHFQDSFGSGRTCRCMLASIENNLNQLNKYGTTTLIVANDAFDQENPPTTEVRRILMSKAEMSRLNLLDEDGYVKRTTVITNSTGTVLSTLPVNTEDELTTHVEQVVIPTLLQIKS